MVDVARHTDTAPVPRQEIAQRQNISADYVAQLFRELAEARLVEGVKGPGGGYRLARAAATITALDVVQAVEGPIALVDCVIPEEDPGCSRAHKCATHRLWRRLSQTMAQTLGSVTLEDLSETADRFGNED
jgi:Rrf2 family iron-sulfur cluster assembly transcriptional regulator